MEDLTEALKKPEENIENLIRQLLIEIGEDPDRAGLLETPKRVAKYWKEFIDYQLIKHPEPYRSKIAKNINNFINSHYQKTSEPILATHHYSTGIGWNFLLKIAIRGDYKGRQIPKYTSDKKSVATQKKVYMEERYAKG
jgi:hypothetical protein